MKKILKFFLGFLKFILSFLLVILLSVILYVTVLRSINKDYFKSENIKKQVESISIKSFIKDDDENDINGIASLKEEFNHQGIDENIIDKILDSKVLKDTIANVIIDGTNYIIDGKVKEYTITKESIVDFASNNIDDIVLELEKNKLIEKNKYDDSKQKEIIKEIEKESEKLEKDINELIKDIDTSLKEDEDFKKINDNMDTILKVIRFLYGKTLTFILITLILFIIFLLMILGKNKLKRLKYVGLSFFISGIAFLITKYMIYYLIDSSKDTKTIYDILKVFFDVAISSLKIYSIIFIILGIILIFIRPIIKLYQKILGK